MADTLVEFAGGVPPLKAGDTAWRLRLNSIFAFSVLETTAVDDAIALRVQQQAPAVTGNFLAIDNDGGTYSVQDAGTTDYWNQTDVQTVTGEKRIAEAVVVDEATVTNFGFFNEYVLIPASNTGSVILPTGSNGLITIMTDAVEGYLHGIYDLSTNSIIALVSGTATSTTWDTASSLNVRIVTNTTIEIQNLTALACNVLVHTEA